MARRYSKSEIRRTRLVGTPSSTESPNALRARNAIPAHLDPSVGFALIESKPFEWPPRIEVSDACSEADSHEDVGAPMPIGRDTKNACRECGPASQSTRRDARRWAGSERLTFDRIPEHVPGLMTCLLLQRFAFRCAGVASTTFPETSSRP